jgi:hypothetical protein
MEEEKRKRVKECWRIKRRQQRYGGTRRRRRRRHLGVRESLLWLFMLQSLGSYADDSDAQAAAQPLSLEVEGGGCADSSCTGRIGSWYRLHHGN